MPDRENVIKELKKLHGTKETMDIIFDAITLLREQEPVQFKVTRQDKSYPFWDSVCTGCGYKTSTVKDYWNYCPVCGRKVKRDA